MRDRDAMPVPAAARLLSIPERSLRRYLDRHSRYLEFRKSGRQRLLSAQSLPILEQIRNLYEAGHTADQVDQALVNAAVPMTVEVPTNGHAPALLVADLLAATATGIERLHQTVVELEAELVATRELLGQQAKAQGAELATLRQRVIDLTAAMERTGGEHRQAIEGLTRSTESLQSDVRQSMAVRPTSSPRPWWRFWER